MADVLKVAGLWAAAPFIVVVAVALDAWDAIKDRRA